MTINLAIWALFMFFCSVSADTKVYTPQQVKYDDDADETHAQKPTSHIAPRAQPKSDDSYQTVREGYSQPQYPHPGDVYEADPIVEYKQPVVIKKPNQYMTDDLQYSQGPQEKPLYQQSYPQYGTAYQAKKQESYFVKHEPAPQGYATYYPQGHGSSNPQGQGASYPQGHGTSYPQGPKPSYPQVYGSSYPATQLPPSGFQSIYPGSDGYNNRYAKKPESYQSSYPQLYGSSYPQAKYPPSAYQSIFPTAEEGAKYAYSPRPSAHRSLEGNIRKKAEPSSYPLLVRPSSASMDPRNPKFGATSYEKKPEPQSYSSSKYSTDSGTTYRQGPEPSNYKQETYLTYPEYPKDSGSPYSKDTKSSSYSNSENVGSSYHGDPHQTSGYKNSGSSYSKKPSTYAVSDYKNDRSYAEVPSRHQEPNYKDSIPTEPSTSYNIRGPSYQKELSKYPVSDYRDTTYKNGEASYLKAPSTYPATSYKQQNSASYPKEPPTNSGNSYNVRDESYPKEPSTYKVTSNKERGAYPKEPPRTQGSSHKDGSSYPPKPTRDPRLPLFFSMYEKRVIQDPVSKYGKGPWRYLTYGHGISYGSKEPGKIFEKGYGYVRALGRDHCKYSKSECTNRNDDKPFEFEGRKEPYFGYRPH